jgi:hypothetical protein
MRTKFIIYGLLFACLVAPLAARAQKKVALVTFYSDKKIGGTGLGTAIESLINDPSFNLQPLVDKSYDRFVNKFAKDFPFVLLDKSVLTNNPEYKNYRSSLFVDTAKTYNKLHGLQYVTAADLILAYSEPSLLKEENRDECNLAKIIKEADGVLLVTMDYEFESRLMGLGAGVRASLNLYLFDKECKKVFRIRESAASKGKVAAVGGIPVMDPKKIQPLCEDATDELFEDLDGKLDKIIKKSAKKF